MTLIGDALNKAGVQVASAISTDDKVKITIETKICWNKEEQVKVMAALKSIFKTAVLVDS